MSKCQAETHTGNRCTRYASDRASKFCWQHTKEKKIDKKDYPKRPLSAFMLFAGDAREGIKAEHPDWDIPAIAREIGAMWKSEPEYVRQRYNKIAEENQKKYKEAVAALSNE